MRLMAVFVLQEMHARLHKCTLSALSASNVVISFAAIKEKYSDWTEFLVKELTGSRTAPANLLEGVCIIENT